MDSLSSVESDFYKVQTRTLRSKSIHAESTETPKSEATASSSTGFWVSLVAPKSYGTADLPKLEQKIKDLKSEISEQEKKLKSFEIGLIDHKNVFALALKNIIYLSRASEQQFVEVMKTIFERFVQMIRHWVSGFESVFSVISQLLSEAEDLCGDPEDMQVSSEYPDARDLAWFLYVSNQESVTKEPTVDFSHVWKLMDALASLNSKTTKSLGKVSKELVAGFESYSHGLAKSFKLDFQHLSSSLAKCFAVTKKVLLDIQERLVSNVVALPEMFNELTNLETRCASAFTDVYSNLKSISKEHSEVCTKREVARKKVSTICQQLEKANRSDSAPAEQDMSDSLQELEKARTHFEDIIIDSNKRITLLMVSTKDSCRAFHVTTRKLVKDSSQFMKNLLTSLLTLCSLYSTIDTFLFVQIAAIRTDEYSFFDRMESCLLHFSEHIVIESDPEDHGSEDSMELTRKVQAASVSLSLTPELITSPHLDASALVVDEAERSHEISAETSTDQGELSVESKKDPNVPLNTSEQRKIIENPSLSGLQALDINDFSSDDSSIRGEQDLETPEKNQEIAPLSATPADEDLRQKQFRERFGFPEQERLISSYACAYAKSFPLQGRLYVSRNHLVFSSPLKAQNIQIALRDVSSVEKENTAGFIPNAIKITTMDKTEYLFISFLCRTEAYTCISDFWTIQRTVQETHQRKSSLQTPDDRKIELEDSSGSLTFSVSSRDERQKGYTILFQGDLAVSVELIHHSLFAESKESDSRLMSLFQKDGLTELSLDNWIKSNPDDGWKRRQIRGTRTLSAAYAMFGAKIASVTLNSQLFYHNGQLVFRQTSQASGIMYSDCFVIHTDWDIIPIDASSCRLTYGVRVEFIKYVFVSGIITKSVEADLKTFSLVLVDTLKNLSPRVDSTQSIEDADTPRDTVGATPSAGALSIPMETTSSLDVKSLLAYVVVFALAYLCFVWTNRQSGGQEIIVELKEIKEILKDVLAHL